MEIICDYGTDCRQCDCCTNAQVVAAVDAADSYRFAEFALSNPEDFVLTADSQLLETLLNTELGLRLTDNYVSDHLLEFANWLNC